MPPLSPAGELTVTLAITGASGSSFAAEALRQLHADPRVARIHLITSPSALRVLAEESGINGRADLAGKLLAQPTTAQPTSAQPITASSTSKVITLAYEDIGAPVASGSYPVHAMLVLPCSMGTLAGIAHGLADNLITRAADVCLKERRPLLLCTRETPLNLIHIRNMAAATEAGATLFPITPTFYNHPQTVADITRNFTHRLLQHIGLPQHEAFQWGQPNHPPQSPTTNH